MVETALEARDDVLKALPVPTPAFDASVWRILGSPLLSGADDGPLAGETVAVKDLFEVAGFAVGAGVPEYLRHAVPATTTAPAVRAMLDAGASVHGIARTDEFAYSLAGTNEHYGTPPNPRVPGGLPGGSSSGPAAAVALGHASIGLGTDTAGSTRVPASYQGLWGLRSTHDAVSREGLLALAPSFDAVGWLTRTPELLGLVAEASLAGDAQVSAPTDYAVAVSLVFAAEEGVQAAFVDSLDRLESAGLIPEPHIVDVGDLVELSAAFRTVQAAEAWREHGAWVGDHAGALGGDVARRFDWARQVSESEEADARGRLSEAHDRLNIVLDGRILLLPSTPSGAPDRGATGRVVDATRIDTVSLTCLAAIGGYPAVSAPLLSVAGRPVGLGLVGPRLSDVSLVATAARLVGID
ncbi:amidase family protein [Cryobacterium roopkundense]|uniref:Asp-tRNA(Asn)/Glu-tRNA(Gln) amidotransferase A subunit family amidase n=1 Tax=Cryobacterium roopkundense TaxID=1001240 RepID=A0A7W9E3V1_9MICO|nr:amidase family protein [Cryobacterium roopkundense]MBB5640779.1 Asp-tRNA(Asn)/Glu-tRNA(Gln) amidotransferase A subunit family amidase [Cryobacterium roopkundense]